MGVPSSAFWYIFNLCTQYILLYPHIYPAAAVSFEIINTCQYAASIGSHTHPSYSKTMFDRSDMLYVKNWEAQWLFVILSVRWTFRIPRISLFSIAVLKSFFLAWHYNAVLYRWDQYQVLIYMLEALVCIRK